MSQLLLKKHNKQKNSSGASAQDGMSSRLKEFFRAYSPEIEDIQLLDLENISSGWESDLYAFTFSSSTLTCELVLRLYNGAGAEDKAENEYYDMLNLLLANYPVPHVYAYVRSSEWFGKPFIIMQKINGDQMWKVFDKAPIDQKMAFGRKMCEVYLQLHHLDWRLFVEADQEAQMENPYAFVDHWLNIGYGAMQAYPDLGFEPLIKWIEDHREDMACHQPAVTHNDFHPGNLLLQEDGELVVIDWTGLEISDARFDLAWTLLLINAYSGSEWYHKFIQAYEQAAGAPLENLKYFEVFACTRRLYDIMVSLKYGAESLGMRPEAVEQMKASKSAHQRVYKMLIERTNIPLPSVEAMIASL